MAVVKPSFRWGISSRSENHAQFRFCCSVLPFMYTSGSTRESGHTAVNTLVAGSGLATLAVSLVTDGHTPASGRTSVTTQAVIRHSLAGRHSTSICALMTLPGNLIPKRTSQLFSLIPLLGLNRIEIQFQSKEETPDGQYGGT